MRKIEQVNTKMVVKLLEKIISGIDSMRRDYIYLYSQDELMLLDNISKLMSEQIEMINIDNYNQDYVNKVLEYEDILKPLVFRCWILEVENGCRYISWLKENKLKDTPKVISATFSRKIEDTFCDARYGISYEVFLDGFLGACNKDAATIIEDKSKESLYTVGVTDDSRVINSYNLATPVITPLQVFDKDYNDYKSKHNETILDSKYIRPISVIYTDENDLDMVNQIGLKYNIPVIFEKKSRKTK